MRAILAIILITSAMTITVPAMAASRTPAPPSPLIDAGRAPSDNPPLARSVVLGEMKLDPAGLVLADVRQGVGFGVVEDIGTGTERMTWLCYDLPQAKARLWLSREESASAVTLTSAASGASCPVLPAKFPSIAVDGFVTLGTPRSALIEKLGKPGLEAGDWLVFRNGSRSLTVRMEQGRVAALWAGGD